MEKAFSILECGIISRFLNYFGEHIVLFVTLLDFVKEIGDLLYVFA